MSALKELVCPQCERVFPMPEVYRTGWCMRCRKELVLIPPILPFDKSRDEREE